MQNNKKLEEIRKYLPYGAKTMIAERLQITPRTVEKILNGGKAHFKNIINVIREAEAIVAEYKAALGEF
jgi:hypothetical protein